MANTGYAVVANFTSKSVSIVTIAAGTVAHTVTVGTDPDAVAITPAGTFAVVCNEASDSVSIVKIATGTVAHTVTVGTSPHAVAITPAGTYAVVANLISDSVSIVTIAAGTVAHTVTVGTDPIAVAITPAGTYAVVANYASKSDSIVTIAAGTVAHTVTVGNQPCAVAITPVGTYAVVANYTSDSVSIVKIATGTVAHTVTVGTSPGAVAITPAGTYAVVANSSSDSVSIVTIAAGTVAHTVTVGTDPDAVAITPAGTYAVVCNHTSASVSIVDIAAATVRSVTLGKTNDAVAITPAGTYAVVALVSTTKVKVVKIATGTVASTVTVGSLGAATTWQKVATVPPSSAPPPTVTLAGTVASTSSATATLTVHLALAGSSESSSTLSGSLTGVATALTIYGTTSNLEDTSTNGYIGECETSDTTTAGTGALSGYSKSDTAPGWFSIPLTAQTAGEPERGVLTSQPAFGTGNATGKPNGTAYNGLSDKQVVAGAWSVSGELIVNAIGYEWHGGELHIRVGTRHGSTFTQYGSDLTVSIGTIRTGTPFTATGTIPKITLPTATTWLYIDATIHTTTEGTGGAGSRIYVKLGSTNFTVVTPGYRLPVVTGTASFTGSGTFAATPTYVGTASFVASGVFGYFGPRATFLASGVFSGQGAAFLPSKTGMPATSVQLALTGTCWTGTNWVTIGPLVKQFSTTRGRQHQLQRVEPGQCTLTLSNRDGRFNPWSHNTPYYNQLPATDSNPTAGEGTWAATGGTLARTTTLVRYGSYAWSLTATAAGTMSAVTDSGTACTPKRTYVAVVYARAAATARAVKVAIVWKKSTGTIISTVTGTARDDATGTWGTTPWTVRAVAPATAAKKEVKVTFSSVADDEVHYVACAGIFDVTYTTGLAAVGQGWCVGQESPLWPGQPIKVTATWHGAEYPIFTGIMKSWVPKYGMVAGDIVVTANDTMHLMANNPVPTSGYSAIITLSDPTLFWTLSTSKVLDSSGNGHNGTASTTFLTFNGTPLVTGTTSECAAFHLEDRQTETGTITVSLTQPTNWSVELALKFTATNDEPTLDDTKMTVNVFSWGSGATRIRLVALQTKTRTNYLLVRKGTTFGTSYLEVTIGSSAHHVVVTHASTGTTQLFVNDVNTATHPFTPSTYAPTFQLGGQSSGYLTGKLYVQDVSIYDHVLSDTEIKTHYTAWEKGFSDQLSGLQIKTLLKATGVPKSTLGTMATGTILCKPPLVTKGETQLLSVLQTTDNTEQGLLFCGATGKVKFLSRAQVGATGTPRAIIADDNTGGHYHPFVSPVPSRDDTTLFNYIAVGVQGTTATNPTAITPDLVKIASTATSAAKYGRRMLTGYTGMYFKNVATAQTLANLLLPRLATPATRVRAVQLSSVSGAGENLPIMLGFELLTLVEVWWQPLDGSDTPFIQTAGIEQIKHTVTKTKWVTTWVLAIPIP